MENLQGKALRRGCTDPTHLLASVGSSGINLCVGERELFLTPDSAKGGIRFAPIFLSPILVRLSQDSVSSVNRLRASVE